MASTNGIFIFTKNRGDSVTTIIEELGRCEYPIFVIDDSTDERVRRLIRTLCKRIGMYYHGLEEQTNLIKSIGKNAESRFLKVLGDGEWNLGFSRNHALLLASQTGFDKALFLDDDISIKSITLISDIFTSLDYHQIAGSRIIGMPDDSVLGHIASKVNVHHKRLYSGGCLAFKVSLLSEYFLNIYNEDWIWQYMQFAGHSRTWVGEVHHKVFNPFDGWKEKIIFQEIGELLVDGLENATDTNLAEVTAMPEFWSQQIQERIDYLTQLKKQCDFCEEKELAGMIDYVLKNYPISTGEYCKNIFDEYSFQRDLFQKVKLELSAFGSHFVV